MLPLVPLIPNYLYILGGHGRYKSLGRDHQSVRINISTCGTLSLWAPGTMRLVRMNQEPYIFNRQKSILSLPNTEKSASRNQLLLVKFSS